MASEQLKARLKGLVQENAASMVMDAGIDPATPADIFEFTMDAGVSCKLPKDLQEEWEKLCRDDREKLVKDAIGDKEYTA